jgi:Tn3 transposase DDE domain
MDDRLLARRDRLRRRCQAGLNKGEARHFLAHAVYVHRQGRITRSLVAAGNTTVGSGPGSGERNRASVHYWDTDIRDLGQSENT